MRFPLLISALTLATLAGLLTACTTPTQPVEPEVSPLTSCAQPRPQVCTMIFAPVCATRVDGSLQTYASGCNACADDQVSSYLSGACEDEGNTL